MNGEKIIHSLNLFAEHLYSREATGAIAVYHGLILSAFLARKVQKSIAFLALRKRPDFYGDVRLEKSHTDFTLTIRN